MANKNGSGTQPTNRPQTVTTKSLTQKTWPTFDTPSKQTPKLKRRQYTYTCLKDVQPESVVDVYGVVKFFKLPQKTRGTDYGQVISIIDPSICGNSKLMCLLFARDEASLPPVKVGSIVRFHRLQIGLHNGELQATKASGFSWLVIDGNAQGPLIQKASTTNYTFTDLDREKIQQLQEWVKDQEDLKYSQKSHCLETIVPGGYFNLVCQVVSVCQIEDTCLLFQVWDGTCPNYPIRDIETGAKDFVMNSDQELLEKGRGYIFDVCLFDDHVKKAVNIQPKTFIKLYNLHAAKYKNETCEGVSGSEVLELVLHRGTSYGRGMKALSDSDPEVCTLRGTLQKVTPRPEKRPRENSPPPRQPTETSEPQPGCSTDNALRVPFQNQTNTRTAGYDVSSPNKIPRLTDGSQVTICPVSGASSPPEQTQPMSEANYCMISTISVIDGHQNIPFSNISDVIECQRPFKFRLLTRVLDYFPRIDASPNLIKLYCSKCHYIVSSNNTKYSRFFLPNGFRKGPKCPECPTSKRSGHYLEYIFKLKLLLTDSLGYMIANLWKEDAVKFFDGLTPEMVLNNALNYTRLLDFLQMVCPNKKSLSQRPMLECCIKSYTNSESSLVCYQLFDTILVK